MLDKHSVLAPIWRLAPNYMEFKSDVIERIKVLMSSCGYTWQPKGTSKIGEKAAIQIGYQEPSDTEQREINKLFGETGSDFDTYLLVWNFYHDTKLM